MVSILVGAVLIVLGVAWTINFPVQKMQAKQDAMGYIQHEQHLKTSLIKSINAKKNYMMNGYDVAVKFKDDSKHIYVYERNMSGWGDQPYHIYLNVEDLSGNGIDDNDRSVKHPSPN